jgi:hypothetical protein
MSVTARYLPRLRQRVAEVTLEGRTYSVRDRATALAVDRIVDETRKRLDPDWDSFRWRATQVVSAVLDRIG